MRSFSEYNPITLIIYYISVTAITMFGMDPAAAAISLAFSALYCCIWSGAKKGTHVFAAVLFIVLAAINPLTVHNGATVLFYLNSRPVTLEAALYGVTAAVVVTATLYRLRSLTSDLSGEKLMYIFGRFSPKLALLLSMSLRYVDLLKSRWRRIQDSQRALGLYNDGNLIDAARGRLRVLSVLITWSLENGMITAQSMESRGFGSGRRTSFSVFRFRAADLLVILFTLAATALTAAGIHSADFGFYPTLTGDPLSPLSAAGYSAYAVLAALPIIINTKEAVRWRALRSGI